MLSRLWRPIIAALVATLALVIVHWFDAGVLVEAQRRMASTFDSSELFTLMPVGHLLAAAGVVAIVAAAWWSRSLSIGVGYSVVGGSSPDPPDARVSVRDERQWCADSGAGADRRHAVAVVLHACPGSGRGRVHAGRGHAPVWPGSPRIDVPATSSCCWIALEGCGAAHPVRACLRTLKRSRRRVQSTPPRRRYQASSAPDARASAANDARASSEVADPGSSVWTRLMPASR